MPLINDWINAWTGRCEVKGCKADRKHIIRHPKTGEKRYVCNKHYKELTKWIEDTKQKRRIK